MSTSRSPPSWTRQGTSERRAYALDKRLQAGDARARRRASPAASYRPQPEYASAERAAGGGRQDMSIVGSATFFDARTFAVGRARPLRRGRNAPRPALGAGRSKPGRARQPARARRRRRGRVPGRCGRADGGRPAGRFACRFGFRSPKTPQAALALQPPLARDRVRYVGEPVALVVASNPYAARSAADLVATDIEQARSVLDVTTAEAAEPSTKSSARTSSTASPSDTATSSRGRLRRRRRGDLRAAGRPASDGGAAGNARPRRRVRPGSRTADAVGVTKVKQFQPQPSSGAKTPELPVEERSPPPRRRRRWRVRRRGELYPEDVLIAFAARLLGRPVKWIEERHEHLLATNHAREQVHEVEVAAAGQTGRSSRSATAPGATRGRTCGRRASRRPCSRSTIYRVPMRGGRSRSSRPPS